MPGKKGVWGKKKKKTHSISISLISRPVDTIQEESKEGRQQIPATRLTLVSEKQWNSKEQLRQAGKQQGAADVPKK